MHLAPPNPPGSPVGPRARAALVSFSSLFALKPMRLLLSFLIGLLPLASALGQSAEAPRIVTLGGSVTEIVYALGAGEQVVGVDASSIYPEEAQANPSMGYFRQVPAEGVLSMNPSLVLALDGTGPPSVLEQLRSAGVRVESVPDESSVDGAKQKIRRIGAILERTDEAEALIQQMEQDLADARALREATSTTPRALFVYARGSGTMNVAGRGTSAEAMIELAGATNAITGFEGFKPLTDEAVVNAAPDVIVMLERGLESVGGVDGVLEQASLNLTPAGQNRRVVAMDDLLFLGFGPRLGEAVRELTVKLHPEVDTAAE